MARAYLDYNASAPLRPVARQALLDALDGGNASSPHAEGQRARATVEQSRRDVAHLVTASAREVVFTASGSEAVNLALQGALGALAFARSEVVACRVEHDAVLKTSEALAADGVRTVPVGVDADGVVQLEALAEAIGERTALVALMLANNETGAIQPVAEAAALAHRSGALLLCDAVQAAGKVEVDFRALGADFLALSAHKLGGPQGVGALVVRRYAPLQPIVHGGGQERGLRAGTENVAAIAGFAAAARAAGADLAAEGRRLAALRDRLEQGIRSLLPEARINAARAPRLPNTTSVTLPGADAQTLVVRLDLEGVAASTGSACASGAAEPSHVLTAMGLSPADSRSTLRFSLGWGTTADCVEHALVALARALAAQREAGLSPRSSLASS